MDATLLAVKLVATPLVILLIYAIERRWGHAVAGLVFGLPLTSSLATAFLAAEQGAAFARDTAAGMQAGIAVLGVFLLAFGHAAARRASWPLALAVALAAYAPAALLFGWLDLGFAAATAIGIGALALAVVAMPRNLGPAAPRPLCACCAASRGARSRSWPSSSSWVRPSRRCRPASRCCLLVSPRWARAASRGGSACPGMDEWGVPPTEPPMTPNPPMR